jgi:hypothetical protein
MKNATSFILLFLIVSALRSQTVEATALGPLTSKSAVRVGVFPGFYNFKGESSYAYENGFDSDGNVREKKSYCLNITDIPLKSGYLEFGAVAWAQATEFSYIDYASSTSKKVDVQSLIKLSKKSDVYVLRPHAVNDYFMIFALGKLYKINEKMEVVKTFESKFDFLGNSNLFELFSDGCAYSIYKDETTLHLRKIDIENGKEYELNFKDAVGEKIVQTDVLMYSYQTYSFQDPQQVKFKISKDGDKSFLGFFPGVIDYTYHDDELANRAKKMRCIVINNANFSIEMDEEIDIPAEFLIEARKSEKTLPRPLIEDVEFLKDEIILSTSTKSYQQFNIDPIAIYRIKTKEKKIEYDGMITNKFEGVLTRDREGSQIFAVNGRIYLVYFTYMTDEKAYKAVNNTYGTLHVIDITTSDYDHQILKDGLEVLDKSRICTFNYTTLKDNSVLFMAAKRGVSSYENLCAVKLTFK